MDGNLCFFNAQTGALESSLKEHRYAFADMGQYGIFIGLLAGPYAGSFGEATNLTKSSALIKTAGSYVGVQTKGHYPAAPRLWLFRCKNVFDN